MHNNIQIITLLYYHLKININMFFPDNKEGVTLLINRVIHNNIIIVMVLLDHPIMNLNLR